MSIAKGAIIGVVTGLILSDIIPTPADSIYFKIERKLRDQWTAGEISPEQYWSKTAAAYYLLNPIWWSIVGIAALSIGQNPKHQLGLLATIAGAGAVAGTIMKNIRKDYQTMEEHYLENKKKFNQS